MWRHAVLCGVVGVFAGCSDSGRSAPEISSVREVAGLVRSEGLGCREVRVDDPAEPKTIGVIEGGSCEVAGVADVGLSIFETRNAVETVFDLAHATEIPCVFIGDDRLYTAIGPTWTISFPSSSNSDDEPSRRGAWRVSERLGIELEVIECRDGEPVD